MENKIIRYKEERRIIRKAMERKKLVLFIGAGTSLDSGMPSWNKAVNKIANCLGITTQDDDNLKIPQYYYNSRGKKEYVELMREIFRYDEELEITDVHRQIIQFNTSTIITTNYDNLIEKAAAENGEFIQVISQDKELPYRTAEKEIIKMHGDFEHDNFVLKEDDYLHYSSNFKLIETYIKSLIANNTVLFIGYSYNDPDVKQIFTWVKDILGKDFQRAYMLEVCDSYNVNKYEYFRNLGVNVLYLTEAIKGGESIGPSERLQLFLEYILSEEKSDNLIDEIYEYLKPFSEMNYTWSKYVVRAFQKYGIRIHNGNMEFYSYYGKKEEKASIELLETIMQKEGTDVDYEQKKNVIRSILIKSSVRNVIINEKKKDRPIGLEKTKFVVEEHEVAPYINAVLEFDYEKMRQMRDENEINLTEEVPHLYLQQAYLCYVLEEYNKSYRYLRAASKIFYKKKMYIWYFISEMNRVHIGNMVELRFGGTNECDKIKQEIKNIDLDKTFSKIPDLGNDRNQFLRDLYTFQLNYVLFQDTYLQTQKVEQEAKTLYTIYGGIPEYVTLRSHIQDYNLYEMSNYIMRDCYKEDIEIYRLYARGIIKSVCSGDKKTEQEHEGFDSGNVRAAYLDTFDIYIILRYMRQKELETLLKDNSSGKILLAESGSEYLATIIPRLYKPWSNSNEAFWVLVTLIVDIKINEFIAEKIINEFIKNLTTYDIRVYKALIIRVLLAMFNQKVMECNVNVIQPIMKQLIDKFIMLLGTEKIEMQFVHNLLHHCIYVYKESFGVFESYELDKIMDYKFRTILVDIYTYCDDNTQRKIKVVLKKWKINNNFEEVSVYEKMLTNNIISPINKIERWIIENIDTIKTKKSAYESVINSLTSLYLQEKIVNKEKIQQIVLQSNIKVYQWLVDMVQFDYSTFEISWLKNCTPPLLFDIAQHPVVWKNINEILVEAFKQEEKDEKILSIYFKYFASYSNMDSIEDK